MTLKPAPTGARLNAGRSGLGQRAAAASRGGSTQGRRLSAASSLLTESIHLRRRQVVHVALLGSAAVCSQPAAALAAALDGFQLEEGGEEPVAEPGESASGSGDQKGGRGRLKDNGERIPEEEVAPGSERGDSDVDSDSASDSSDSESGSDSESDSDSDSDEEEGRQVGAPEQQKDERKHKQGERQKEEQEQKAQQQEKHEGLGEEEKRRRKEEKRQLKKQRREQEAAAAAQAQLEAEADPSGMGKEAVRPAGVAAQQGPPQRDVLHHWTSDSGAEPDGLLAELLL